MSKDFLQQVAEETRTAWRELLAEANLKKGDLLVLGCSSSEIRGKNIGQASSIVLGHEVITASREVLEPLGLHLAVQACEHLNRSLVVEREVAEKFGLEQVYAVPALHAGGSTAMAAYAQAKDPVMVAHVVAKAGLDIGNTAIGMHIKYVQIPLRLETKKIGQANLNALKSRLPRIGGERTQYEFDLSTYENDLAKALASAITDTSES